MALAREAADPDDLARPDAETHVVDARARQAVHLQHWFAGRRWRPRREQRLQLLAGHQRDGFGFVQCGEGADVPPVTWPRAALASGRGVDPMNANEQAGAGAWPEVSVVVATRHRPELLLRAVTSILASLTPVSWSAWWSSTRASRRRRPPRYRLAVSCAC